MYDGCASEGCSPAPISGAEEVPGLGSLEKLTIATRLSWVGSDTITHKWRPTSLSAGVKRDSTAVRLNRKGGRTARPLELTLSRRRCQRRSFRERAECPRHRFRRTSLPDPPTRAGRASRLSGSRRRGRGTAETPSREPW